MAVPKTTQTRYMDGSVQRTTQVTPSLHHFFIFVFCTKMFPVISQQSLDTRSIQKKKRCRLGTNVYLYHQSVCTHTSTQSATLPFPCKVHTLLNAHMMYILGTPLPPPAHLHWMNTVLYCVSECPCYRLLLVHFMRSQCMGICQLCLL